MEGLGVSGLGGKGLGFTRIFGGLGDWGAAVQSLGLLLD